MKQNLIELKREKHNKTAIAGEFNTLITIMDRTTRQKISEETEDLNSTINQLDLIYFYRTFYPPTADTLLFAHGK